MRRLFSSFARGWPGVGLLLLRLVNGATLVHFGAARLLPEMPIVPAIPPLLAIGAGILLSAGLWTPVAGTSVAILGLCNILSQSADPWMSILVAAIGAALALLGPGSWSVDARLFGWKRLDIRIRK